MEKKRESEVCLMSDQQWAAILIWPRSAHAQQVEPRTEQAHAETGYSDLNDSMMTIITSCQQYFDILVLTKTSH